MMNRTIASGLRGDRPAPVPCRETIPQPAGPDLSQRHNQPAPAKPGP